ncbi:Stability protein (Toxin) [Escherichia coli O111:H8 str. CVM9570]|nr:Stability protein (Toxin) [Escherichia coli O111:H8 str. CVM9570]
MTYTVKFRDDALREWLKLDKSVQQQFAKKLKKMQRKSSYTFSKTTWIKRLLQNKTSRIRFSSGLSGD